MKIKSIAECSLWSILQYQGTKVFQYCTRPAGRVTYNFHLSCKHMHSSLKIVLYAIKKMGGGGGGGGVDVFEDPYITAKMIFTHCSKFHNCIPYTDKKSFTFSWDFLFSKLRLLSAFSAGTFVCQNPRLTGLLIYYDHQHSVSIITAIHSVTIQTYFIDKNALRKNQYLLRYSLPHYYRTQI